MKNLFRVIAFLAIDLLFIACGVTAQNPTAPRVTALPIDTLAPSQIATAHVVSTSTPTYVPPTLIPTIDPELAPSLLSKAISIQTLAGVNGHSIQKITGWDYGFRQYGLGRQPCNSYQWLDSNHLLLYPRTGEVMKQFMDGGTRTDLIPDLVVISLTDGTLWLTSLQSRTSTWGLNCDSAYWSQELGIIISQENYGTATSPTKEAIIAYTFDGQEIARYWGKIVDVSPKGTKVMVNDDAIIDLRNNKITDLTWHIDRDGDYSLGISPKLYWSSDETQVYRCCFYYANLNTGRSYNFEWSDLRGADRKSAPFSIQPHTDGAWVRNDTYFFVKWDYMSYAGDPTVMFNPVERKYYVIELTETSAIRADTATYTISPDGMYVWIMGYDEVHNESHDILFNLNTFETTSYDTPVIDFEWSADGKFGWANGLDSPKAYILSVASKNLLPFPVNPRREIASWHPKENILAYMAENDESLALLNAKDMIVEGRKLPVSVIGFLWSPNGDHMVFISKDWSLWQVDYPTFQNFEQLTEPMADINDIFWSPDGKSIAFVSGSDIYIVDTTK